VIRKSMMICGVILVFVSVGCGYEKEPLPTLEPDHRAVLRAWLDDNGAPPEQYILSKFTDHDIVFLGEYHRIRHDVILVQNMIPILHRNGIFNLGLEFLRNVDQDEIDNLLSAETYDETLANSLFWNEWPFWGYKEYIDILRVAWRFNRDLPPDIRRFRIVGLNARMDWSHVWSNEDRASPELMSLVFPDGNPDEVMAGTIVHEILNKNEKALIYSGINHAYTKFKQPVLDPATNELVRHNSTRMGNRIYDKIADRCCTIFLHSPWPASTGYGDPDVYPADGIIDALFKDMSPGKRRIGFDVKNSPFGELNARTALWSHSKQDFRLKDFCDGWIYQMPLSLYRGVSVIPDWFNKENRLQAIAQIANADPAVKNTDRSVSDLMNIMASDTDFEWRFSRFQ